MTPLWALVQSTTQLDAARRRTATVGTQFIKVRWLFQDILSVRMLFALDRKAVMYAVGLLQEVKERLPCTCSLFAGQERLGVANDDQCVPSSGQEHIEPLRSSHETYVSVAVATSQAGNDNVGLVTLKVIEVVVSNLLGNGGYLDSLPIVERRIGRLDDPALEDDINPALTRS
jgi:hypothetical protein